MPAPTTQTDDNFADAFAKLADIDNTPPAPVGEAPTPSVTDAETPAGAEGTPEGASAAETPPAGEAPETPPAGEAPAGESADDLMTRLRTMLAEPAPKPVVEPPSPAAAANDEAPPLFTTEEEETLSNYERDWPEVVAGQVLRERKLAVDIVQHIFNQLAPVLRPILDSTTALDTREYLATLESQVPDYRQIRDNVEAWALDEKHPPYLRAAYQHVIQEGTADEVVDLIARYRMEVGGAAPAAPPAKKPVETELPPATKKAVDSLAPVSSKRSVVTGAHDPLDFDGAFSKFADNT